MGESLLQADPDIQYKEPGGLYYRNRAIRWKRHAYWKKWLCNGLTGIGYHGKTGTKFISGEMNNHILLLILR